MDDIEQHSKTDRQSFFSRLLGMNKPESQSDLDEVISDAGDREIIDEHTEDMLHGVFDVSRLRISDIMIPRAEIVTIDADVTLSKAAEVIARYNHSRYPVISGDKDHVVGLLLAKDLIPHMTGGEDEKHIRDLMRPPIIVPETKRVAAMLYEFQAKRYHLALAVDEFGGISGLVTIEDILELIVGDINDEYDDEVEAQDISPVPGSDEYIVKGQTSIEEFEEFFKTSFPEVGADTIAGLVLHSLGHFPKPEEQLTLGQFHVKVLKATKLQILFLAVKKLPEQAEA
ncbi:MAG: CBS domain-containing protein [Succinivibrio sp.]|nr:CBS domain-containing protein [Succinivibrio sp.]